MSKHFIMYTTETCPYCVKAKALLKTHGHLFEEFIVGRHGITREVVAEKIPEGKRKERITVPQIFHGDTYVGGCDDLVKYLAK